MATTTFSKYGKKKTFGAKVKTFLVKAGIYSVGLGSVAGVVNHNYLAHEDITAKVSSVEVTPSGEAGVAPKMVVHTDKGSFVNEPSKLHFKNEHETIELGKLFKEGETVKVSVYGMRPKLGNLTLDDLRMYRNISKAFKVEAAPATVPAAAPAAAVPAAVAPAPAAAPVAAAPAPASAP